MLVAEQDEKVSASFHIGILACLKDASVLRRQMHVRQAIEGNRFSGCNFAGDTADPVQGTSKFRCQLGTEARGPH